jgi:alpha-N-arabinofuranosidase
MDGPWQIGQLQAREYGRKARDAAKQMRTIDPDVRLIACGSSGTFMPTYLTWDREVLEECYDQVDASPYAYYGNTKVVRQQHGALPGDESDMDRQPIRPSPSATQQGLQRSAAVVASFDEWNVWYGRDAQSTDGKRAAAPRAQEVYNWRMRPSADSSPRLPDRGAPPVSRSWST